MLAWSNRRRPRSASTLLQELFSTLSRYDDDYADVRGQKMAQLALVIVAAGAHNC
ncbi:MAG: hypothetical protein ACYC3X_11525 [Pirellulaceae bacterium]